MIRGCALALGGAARSASGPYQRSQQVATLPWFRAGGGSVFAAQSRHEEPYPPMSKINPTIPFILPLTGNVRKYIPFPRRFQAGNAFFGSLQAYRSHASCENRSDLFSHFYQQPMGLWAGPFERCSRACAAKMAALHAAVAGRPSHHRSQQAATLPSAATSATIPAFVAVVGSVRGTLHIATFVAVDANEQNTLRPCGRAIYGTLTMLAVPNYVW